MKTTMITIVLAAMAMTASANTNKRVWGTPVANRVEVRRVDNHDDCRNCSHDRLDRHGNKLFCHYCDAELVWKGGKKNGHYEVVTNHPAKPASHGKVVVSGYTPLSR